MGWIDKALKEKTLTAQGLMKLSEEERDNLILAIGDAIKQKINRLSIAVKTLKLALTDTFSRSGLLKEINEVNKIFKNQMKGLFTKSLLYDLLSKVVENMETVKDILKNASQKMKSTAFKTASTRLLSQLDSLNEYLNALKKSDDYLQLLITKELGQRMELQAGGMTEKEFEPSF